MKPFEWNLPDSPTYWVTLISSPSQLSYLHIILHYLCLSKDVLCCMALKIHISYTVSCRRGGENWEKRVKYWESKIEIRRTKSVELFSWEMVWDIGKKLIEKKMEGNWMTESVRKEVKKQVKMKKTIRQKCRNTGNIWN